MSSSATTAEKCKVHLAFLTCCSFPDMRQITAGHALLCRCTATSIERKSSENLVFSCKNTKTDVLILQLQFFLRLG